MVQRNENSIKLTDPWPAFWKGVICFHLIVFGGVVCFFSPIMGLFIKFTCRPATLLCSKRCCALERTTLVFTVHFSRRKSFDTHSDRSKSRCRRWLRGKLSARGLIVSIFTRELQPYTYSGLVRKHNHPCFHFASCTWCVGCHGSEPTRAEPT